MVFPSNPPIDWYVAIRTEAFERAVELRKAGGQGPSVFQEDPPMPPEISTIETCHANKRSDRWPYSSNAMHRPSGRMCVPR
jgi:hypothetical protein